MAAVLLDTDQRDCFDAHGRPVPCAGSGQDGEAQAPGPSAAERFQLEDDAVRDRLTGLIWAADAALSQFPMHFEEARAWLARLNAGRPAGRPPWRLPDRRQLFSLVSHQQINPALPAGHPFRNVFPGYYWTGTLCARRPEQAWTVHLGGGRVQPGMQHASYMVWPVRAPNPPEIPNSDRITPDAEVFHDRATSRTWRPLMGGEAGGPLTWPAALERIAHLNRSLPAARNPWRLPNIRELESLCDPARHSPALLGFWPGPLPEGFWSATTSRYEPRYAWVLYTRDGAAGVGFKARPDFHALAVRGWGA
jgi:hypothetical protein